MKRLALVWMAGLLAVLGLLPLAARSAETPRRVWQLGEFTAIRLVAREAGSAPNQQPSKLPPDQLHALLASARVTVKGKSQPLFGSDEVNDLVEPLAQALASAGPDDDLLLLSTARRGEGVLVPATGLTARVFVQGQQLQLIVQDPRMDFMGAWIGTRIAPKFSYGTRERASGTELYSAMALSRRPDWLALPLSAATPLTLAAPAAASTPVSPEPSIYQEQEQRLRGLKRLLEQGLLSEAEYQQKRREILQTL